MKAIVNAKIIYPEGPAETGSVLYDDKIVAVNVPVPRDAQVIDAAGMYLSAGFCDTHTHGYMGCNYTQASAEDMAEAMRRLPSTGVTSVLPTIMTSPADVMLRACQTVLKVMADDSIIGARPLGAHLEGPYISMLKRGAQDPRYIGMPDTAELDDLKDVVRVMTLAPELPHASELISVLTRAGITASMGHSDADYETSVRGADEGATRVTHLYNAMRPLNHREVGLVGAALIDSRIYPELIADGYHVSPQMLALTAKLVGDRLILITDSLADTGLDDCSQVYENGIRRVYDGKVFRLDDGTIAGSALTMDTAVRNMVKLAGMSVEAAARAASYTPCRNIGRDDVGVIAEGRTADMVIFDRDINVHYTVTRGMTTYIRGN